VRAQLAGDSSQIEVRLGSHDHTKRLQDALNVLDSQRQTPRGALISYIDLSQGKRAIVGLVSGVHTTSDGSVLSSAPNSPIAPTSEERIDRTGVALRSPGVDPMRAAAGTTQKPRGDKSPGAEKKSNKVKTPTRSEQ
jgi:hypothetical protein